MSTNDTPKPVFPAGVEPPGLVRGRDYEWSGNSTEPPAVAAGGRSGLVSRSRVRRSEFCWYCGDELDPETWTVSVETGEEECEYSPTGAHEIDEAEEAEEEGHWEADIYVAGKDASVSHGLGYPTTDKTEPKSHQDMLWTTSQDQRRQADYVPGDGGYWWKGVWHAYTQQASAGTTSQKYKPDWRTWPWSEWRSHDAATSGNMFTRLYGQYRDAQDGYASCPLRRHWGPRGGAGLVPWTVAPDGKVYVLLSHRSWLVEHGGTWSSFGGAIDKADKDPFAAAVREAFEEVEGLPADGIVTKEVARPCHACGWLYTTFLVQVRPVHVKVNRKAGSGWETTEVRWVLASAVAAYNLHPGFAKTWPELYAAIRAAVAARKGQQRKGSK